MTKEKLIYDFVVGYMLKVIKSKAVITKYKEEFNSIKHGDYVCFINLLNIGIPNNIIVAKEGEVELIPTEKQMEMKNVDFLFLLLSAPALNEFYLKCYQEFGNITDKDLSDEDFEKVANFEMVLRMRVNNRYRIEQKIELINVINLLCSDLLIPKNEVDKIQKGREFINMVKGHRPKFPSYKEGLKVFSEAVEVLKKYDIILTA
jgi:hypothetical protein